MRAARRVRVDHHTPMSLPIRGQSGSAVRCAVSKKMRIENISMIPRSRGHVTLVAPICCFMSKDHGDARQLSADDTIAVSAQLNLVGESAVFRDCLRLIQRMAACDATVLICGETGTGKELAARAIHYLGLRKSAPFIPVNCGALPENLVETELFGHARGAFTDAREARAGMVAQAEGGTLFLDEVEAMGPRAQVALLRFLQEREYRPIGGTLVRGANVRVVASANVDLEAGATQGTFRQDLLFRLNVLPLHLPPLRERGDDVMTLAQTFLRRFSRQYGQPLKTLDADSLAFLTTHTWPGNVRELENLIHRHLLLSDSDVIRIVPDRAPSARIESSFREAKAHAIAEFERRYIAALLARTRGNISLAARLSGKERSRLCKLVKKYGLDRESFASSRPATSMV
jgi:DNA-binding NtrC family response regulator